MLNLFKKLVKPKSKINTEAPKETKTNLTPKQLATLNELPYISVVSMEVNNENIGIGAFELDWNEIFIAKLLKAGYKGTSEEQIVDQWFTDICRNVVLETYEQYEANNPRPPSGIQKKNLGNGRTEVS